ncbi:MAG TPA: protein translocase subunit SecF, partial [Actinomycetota bacterium]|nr:protein translocase subunit SecF [Actinomycetota bacterium]
MMRRLRGGNFNFDIIGRARLWFVLSATILAVSVGSLLVRGINAGLEFRGGTAFQFQARDSGVDVADVKAALGRSGIDEATIQQVGSRGFLTQTEHLPVRIQTRAIGELAELAGVDTAEINVTDIGPKWGAQITNKAIQALIAFLVVLVVYLSIRLEPKMAAAALVALFHDLLATAGFYSLSGFEVTPATVIALLTILGFSLYDTVVVFDRMKERTTGLSAAGRVTYTQVANASLNEVLIRSLNTSIVSLLPVGSLLVVGSYLLGARTLRELALALLIGIGVGMYSSVAVSPPLLAKWKEREQRWATLRARIEARG